MSKVKPHHIFIRLAVLAVLGVGGVYGYQKVVKPYLNNSTSNPQIGQILNSVGGKVQGLAATLNIDSDSLIKTANQKLVDSQPIIKDQVETTSSEVLGESTSALTDQAKKLAEDTASKIADQIKDLPRQEAIKITKTVCEQIVSNLENQ